MAEKAVQLNIAICDDDEIMLEKLQKKCEEILHPYYSLQVLSVQSPELLLGSGEVFQLAILDVKLLEESGIELARQMLKQNPRCRIIFVSGYVHVVSDVYEVPHFCFILKEQLDEKLPRFLLQAAEMAAREAGSILSVKCGKQLLQLPVGSILYLERRGHWSFITMEDGTVWETREKLSSLHSRLGTADFVRCHISYIVNLSYVESVQRRTICLPDHVELPISLPHEQEVQNAFFRHLGK